MKFENIATIVLLALVVETQCGVIDNIYGKVKNTTTGLKQDVTNVWSYGKRLVGLEKENSYEMHQEEKRGLVGGVIHSTREKLQSVHDYFWNSNELSEDKGLFGNMFDRVKKRVSKIKGGLLGENKDGQLAYTESEDAKLIRESLNKLFFRNGTRHVHGKAFQDAIQKLRNKLQEIRNNITASTTSSPIHDGEGLIDVRAFPINVHKTIDANTVGVDNDIYDKVDDTLIKVNDNAAETYKNVKDGVDKGVRDTKDSVTKEFNEFEDKLVDTAAKEKELMDNSYNKFNKDVKIVGENAIEDINPLSYN